jgi:hypothetical protein
VKVVEKTITQFGPLERPNLNHWTPLSDLHSYLIMGAHALGFVGYVYSRNFYRIFYPISTHVGASSQFLLCNFLLSPAESAWSQMIK